MTANKTAHPGKLLKEMIRSASEKNGKDLTLKEVAEGLTITQRALAAIINGTQSVTPEIAIKLATGFKTTTPEMWLYMQDSYSLATLRKKVDTKRIKVFRRAVVL